MIYLKVEVHNMQSKTLLTSKSLLERDDESLLVEQTLFALDNLAQTKKAQALSLRDEIIAEQTMLRNRWKLSGDDIISPKNQ